MDTALYYTFSTISQTLAGAIGLLGAFVLFRLQTINVELQDVGVTVLNCYNNSPDRDVVGALCNAERYAEMVTFVETHPYTDPAAKTPYVASRVGRLQPLVAQRRQVNRWLRIALAHTVCLIAAAVAVLALTPRIVLLPSAPALVLGAGWLWLTACLGVYAQLLRVTLGGEPT